MSGSVRCIQNSLLSIKEIQKTGDVKLFIHTWNFTNNTVSGDLWFHSQDPKELALILSGVIAESIVIEHFESKLPFLIKARDNSNIVLTQNRRLNHIAATYSVFKSNELKKEYEKEHSCAFDIVYRIRTDSNIINSDQLPTSPLTDLVIPKGFDWSGINDQFAYGSSTALDKYSSLFVNLSNLSGSYVNPEQLLAKHLQTQDLTITRSDLLVKIRDL